MTALNPSRAADALTLTVTGMTCQGCAGAVGRVLAAVPGVGRVEVDLAAGLAHVAGSARAEALLAAIRAAGYGAEPAAGDAA